MNHQNQNQSRNSRIYVDDRAGSDSLIKLFPQDLVEVCRLDSADVMFFGAGRGGEQVAVGIEFKSLDDVLKCICDGRFAGKQNIRMAEEYDERWLLVEDETRIGVDDQLQAYRRVKGQYRWVDARCGNRYFKWADYEAWIATMTYKTGLKVRQVKDRRETKHWVMTQYRWWQGGWDKHKSDQVRDQSGRPSLVKASALREFAATLPGVGWGKAANVEKYFISIHDAVNAHNSDWEKVEGIGRIMAERIVEVIRNGRQKEA